MLLLVFLHRSWRHNSLTSKSCVGTTHWLTFTEQTYLTNSCKWKNAMLKRKQWNLKATCKWSFWWMMTSYQFESVVIKWVPHLYCTSPESCPQFFSQKSIEEEPASTQSHFAINGDIRSAPGINKHVYLFSSDFWEISVLSDETFLRFYAFT